MALPGIRVGLALVLALTLAGALVQYLRFVHDYEYLWGLAPLFDPLREANVPTWFTSAVLLLSGVALTSVGVHLRGLQSGDAAWWLVLGATFCLGSLDETANLHELLSRQARRIVQPGFGQVWLLILGPPALAFMAIYARFLGRQDPRVSRPFAIGAALFAGGALGVEAIEALLERAGADELTIAMAMLLQEVMELLGAVTLLHGSVTQLGIVTANGRRPVRRRTT
jgi:hypothetical protein